MPKPPIQIPASTGSLPTDCHSCETADSLSEQNIETSIFVSGEEISCAVPKMKCLNCEATFATVTQADAGTLIAVTTYHELKGLATAAQIKDRRKALGWTQLELAGKSQVSIASIKRFESGMHVLSAVNHGAIDRSLSSCVNTASTINDLTLGDSFSWGGGSLVGCLSSSLGILWDEEESPWNMDNKPTRHQREEVCLDPSELTLAA